MDPNENVPTEQQHRKLIALVCAALGDIRCREIEPLDAVIAAALRLTDLHGDETRTLARVRQLLILASRIAADAIDSFEHFPMRIADENTPAD